MRTIQSFVLLLAVMVLASCDPAPKKVEKSIGLQMYSLRDQIGRDAENVDDIIAQIGEMGYKYVETASYWNGEIYGMSPETFKAKCEAAGLEPLSCHVGDVGSGPVEPNWAAWDLCIDTHQKAGMKYIVIPSMPTPETEAELQAFCDYYNQIGEKCIAAGLKLGYHNHDFEFKKIYDSGISMYDYMVQHTDPAKVFFQLDVYWSQKGNRPASELFAQYPGRFELLHIKDEAELGESGFMNFEDVFKNIDQSGTKYLIVEVERYNLPALESVKVSFDYLIDAPYVKADYSK